MKDLLLAILLLGLCQLVCTVNDNFDKVLNTIRSGAIIPKDSIKVLLTVYDSTSSRLEGGPHNVLGHHLRKGMCAADTSVFPIGTKITIPKLGISLLVQDIGGAVKGFHIDMFVPGSHKNKELWCKESVLVYIESLP